MCGPGRGGGGRGGPELRRARDEDVGGGAGPRSGSRAGRGTSIDATRSLDVRWGASGPCRARGNRFSILGTMRRRSAVRAFGGRLLIAFVVASLAMVGAVVAVNYVIDVKLAAAKRVRVHTAVASSGPL